ncbi:FHA domain-containing protein [Nocardia sp. NPDC049149]|uniref:FHA domain-containing protein n=1 Tax=Nocardia sp. NPDC049149 TaxID=3364315 RepID=UPI0037220ABC
MGTCPEGHSSSALDYCDVCGAPMAPVAAPVSRCPSCGAPSGGRFCEVCGHDSALPAPVSRPAATAEHAAAAQPGATVDPASVADPAATVQPATAVESAATVQPAATVVNVAATVAWVATITADRAFYDRVIARKGPDADQVGFPDFYPERRIVLSRSEILIGKRSVSQGVRPDIDLGIAPADVGVSRTHAMLHLDENGLTVTDLGSTNGTSVNGSDELIPAKVAVPLRSGDRIHLGGWTTIVLSTEPGGVEPA